MTERVNDDQEVRMTQASADPGEGNGTQAESVAGAQEFDVQSLRQELDAAQRDALANQDKYLRARADMDNYKRRMERNYADLARSAKKELLAKLLVVKDNLERALQYGDGSTTTGESVIEGVRLTAYQLDQMLAQEGVQLIEAEGKTFDPRQEEAVHSVNDPSVPDQTVIQVVRQGYTYQEEVLRPAQVVVSIHDS